MESEGAAGPVIDIVGRDVALGPLRPELFERHTEALNDPETRWNIFGTAGQRTLEEEAAWLVAEDARPDTAFFQVHRRDGQDWRPIGVASLSDIDRGRGTATFRIVIWSRDDRGRGLGTEATALVLRHAFDRLDLHNVVLTLYAWNADARRVYERCGFREIGRRREAAPRDGRRWDVIYMDRLATDPDPA